MGRECTICGKILPAEISLSQHIKTRHRILEAVQINRLESEESLLKELRVRNDIILERNEGLKTLKLKNQEIEMELISSKAIQDACFEEIDEKTLEIAILNEKIIEEQAKHEANVQSLLQKSRLELEELIKQNENLKHENGSLMDENYNLVTEVKKNVGQIASEMKVFDEKVAKDEKVSDISKENENLKMHLQRFEKQIKFYEETNKLLKEENNLLREKF